MAKGNAIVMYLEQARIHGEPIGVTHSEVLFTKPNGYTVQPHNRVVSKADNKTMGESFLNELIYVLGAEDGEERKLPYDREVLVYTSDEINSDNYRTYVITPGGQQINYVCVDAFNGHNDVTGYDALQKDDGTVVWGSAELIVYTCLGDAYNVRVACFNRA
jgi:hypothetical protein